MRIVGGRFRGRRLATPKSDRIRPTTDRTRETLFNILGNRFNPEGKRALDLFAGTGALGLEAMSRGCVYALFVDESAEARGLIRENVEALGLQGATRIFRRDATRIGPAGAIEPFDLVFLDPPYGKGLGERAMGAALAGGWLAEDALVLLEERRDALPERVPDFDVVDRREFGDTAILFLERLRQ